MFTYCFLKICENRSLRMASSRSRSKSSIFTLQILAQPVRALCRALRQGRGAAGIGRGGPFRLRGLRHLACALSGPRHPFSERFLNSFDGSHAVVGTGVIKVSGTTVLPSASRLPLVCPPGAVLAHIHSVEFQVCEMKTSWRSVVEQCEYTSCY